MIVFFCLSSHEYLISPTVSYTFATFVVIIIISVSKIFQERVPFLFEFGFRSNCVPWHSIIYFKWWK